MVPFIPGDPATIPNHVDGSRNQIDSLLESGNQVKILESGITILRLFCIFRILRITWYTNPCLVNRNYKNQFRNLGIKPGIQRFYNHVGENSELRTPQVNSIAASGSVEIAQWLILQGDIWSWGGKYILSDRTGFPRKMRSPGHIFMRTDFSSSDTGTSVFNLHNTFRCEERLCCPKYPTPYFSRPPKKNNWWSGHLFSP